MSAGAERLAGHLNTAEHWIRQADNFEFPNAARTEMLQLASIHATLAQALSVTLAAGVDLADNPADGQDCQAAHCPPSATQDCDWPRCAELPAGRLLKG